MDFDITQKKFIRYVFNKLKLYHNFTLEDVGSVILVLFDEIIEDIKRGAVINSANFGELVLKKNNDGIRWNGLTKKTGFSIGRRSLKFSFSKHLPHFILSYLDIEQTFPDIKGIQPITFVKKKKKI